MRVIAQGIISSPEDIGKLRIFDFARCNGYWENNLVRAMRITANWLIGRASYTVIDASMNGYPPRDDWPGWNHTGRSHEPLARLFWNTFLACFEENATLQFADAPDFSGTIFSPEEQKEIHFYGDIGQVSVSTFLLDVLPRLEKGDLWISIPDDHTQILLEPLVNFRDLVGHPIEAALGISSYDQQKPHSEDKLPMQNEENDRPEIIQMSLWG